MIRGSKHKETRAYVVPGITQYTEAPDGVWTCERLADYVDQTCSGVFWEHGGKRGDVAHVAASFDIETSSFYEDGHKRACMYEWTFAIDRAIIYGRTWREFGDLIDALTARLHLDGDHRLVVFVHNLAFEFQFLCRRFTWSRVFAVKSRTPVQAITEGGVEFRCSYLLTGKSLANLAEDVGLRKLVGDLDYSLIRHSGTPLTPEEMAYCYEDVKIVTAYIQRGLRNGETLVRMPLTKTGYVRDYCRNAVQEQSPAQYTAYRQLMGRMTLTPSDYVMLKKAFSGGFTHASGWYSGVTVNDVASYDIASSYPAVLISEKFPASRARQAKISGPEHFRKMLRAYCCMFTVRLRGVRSTFPWEHYISVYHCDDLSDFVSDNGRLVSAAELVTTLTDQDWEIVSRTYAWDAMEILDFRYFYKEYLPRDFVACVLDLYAKKTTLKGVADRAVEYALSKERINSLYGMAVTDIVRPEETFDGQKWKTIPPDVADQIDKYNHNRKRFTFYAWGVWVTAYARARLWRAILHLGTDYIYSDTDSAKFRNADKHTAFFDDLNSRIQARTVTALERLGLDTTLASPKTIKGVAKPIGVFEREPDYARFKTLGAKRYLTEDADGTLAITVAGVNKKTGAAYLAETYDDPFEAFADDLMIPAEGSGKLTHTYIDVEIAGNVVDYLGTEGHYHEYNAVHLEGADYSLSISQAYTDYLLNIKQKEK